MKKFVVFSLVLGLVSPLVTFAQVGQVSDTLIAPPGSPVVVAYDGTCASNAVIAHENTRQTIVETRQVAMKIASTTRRDALGVAYLLTDKTTRDTALKAAHDAFIATQKSTDKIAIDASNTENKSFNSTMKACGAKVPPPIDDQNSPENQDQMSPNQDQQNKQVDSSQNNQNQNNFRTLKQGVRGEDVKNIQKILGLPMDGVYGHETAKKVKEWQAQKGLKEDGVIGHESFKEIEKADGQDTHTDTERSSNHN